jgi:hypothetical protein
MKAKRAFDGSHGSHEGWEQSPVYWASMTASGHPKK